MKPRFDKPLASNLGKDPETGTDMEFYDWITNGDPDNALGKVAAALVEDLRDNADEKELTQLLETWKKNLPKAEMASRLAMLERLMPPGHAYHTVKRPFLKEK